MTQDLATVTSVTQHLIWGRCIIWSEHKLMLAELNAYIFFSKINKPPGFNHILPSNAFIASSRLARAIGSLLVTTVTSVIQLS